MKLDHDTLIQRFANWPLIRVSGTAGMPPEVYRITFQVKGLYVSPTGDILERDTHQLEVNLSLGYPRRAPQCRMLAPVFHPNFDEGSVCIGDFWAASEGLDDLIVRIGRMIAYQEYNTKSPLNGLAAKWAAQNAGLLPIDTRNIAPSSEAAEASVPSDATNVSYVENASTPQSNDPWSQKISLGYLLTNIASMFVDVLPASGERYIVSEGRSHSIPRTAWYPHLLGT